MTDIRNIAVTGGSFRKGWLGVLVAGMTLGTAWAVRGQFGHEQGAAWAGGIGALSLILVSKRPDWQKKGILFALAGAFGWGITGMISYGKVVGYGRSDSYPNALYGLMMLFVIGALFGLLGGGLSALSLESSENKKVKWASLLSEMIAGALLVYGFLVMQIGVLMTPPRSEAWALCLGAGMAMIWHMAENKHRASLRVALFTALGGGFGFAFGNFLQTVGTVLEIRFNMWNVMEYSIGFFGGSAWAYSVFTSKWPEQTALPTRGENRFALVFLFLFIPLIVFRETVYFEHLLNRFGDIPNLTAMAVSSSVAGGILMVACFIIAMYVGLKNEPYTEKTIKLIFFVFFLVYILLSFLVSGLFHGKIPFNHILYLVNIGIVMILINRSFNAFSEKPIEKTNYPLLVKWLVGVLVFIFLLAWVSINIHDGMSGGQIRFE